MKTKVGSKTIRINTRVAMEREIEHRKIDECGNEDSTVIIIRLHRKLRVL